MVIDEVIEVYEPVKVDSREEEGVVVIILLCLN